MLERNKGKFYVSAQFILLVLIALSSGSSTQPAGSSLLGTVVFLCGLAVIGTAAVELRPALTAMPEPKEFAPLIKTGIYSFIRHPMYLGVIFLGYGMTLIHWSLYAAAETMLLCFVLYFKSRYEDLLLREKWPEAINFQTSVGAIFPKRKKI